MVRHHCDLCGELICTEKGFIPVKYFLPDFGETELCITCYTAIKETAQSLRKPPSGADKKWPPLLPGTRVKTTSNKSPAIMWTPEALVARKWGVTGNIIGHHDSHGLCYDVRHDDGTEGCYNPNEFEVLSRGLLFCMTCDTKDNVHRPGCAQAGASGMVGT